MVVDSNIHERLPGEDPRVVQLAPDPEASGIIALKSLTDLLTCCSNALADDAVRTGDDDFPGTARRTLTVTPRMASQELPARAWTVDGFNLESHVLAPHAPAAVEVCDLYTSPAPVEQQPATKKKQRKGRSSGNKNKSSTTHGERTSHARLAHRLDGDDRLPRPKKSMPKN